MTAGIPPELQNTAEKLARARAKRDELQDRVDRLHSAWLAAQEKHYDAARRFDDGPKAVERAQNLLTAAMKDGGAVEHLQAKVAGVAAEIESLRQLRDAAEAIVRQRREALEGPAKALGQAQTEMEEAELCHLAVEIGRRAHEMRPLCTRYRELANARRMGLNDSGLLIDEANPNIGPYHLEPDGTLSPHYFARIA